MRSLNVILLIFMSFIFKLAVSDVQASVVADANPIPKIIHYVWLGKKPLTSTIQENIATWRKHAPDYQIKQWDETNCDINANNNIQKYYHAGNYGVASDWCRLVALYQDGGIYLDTDAVLNKNIDDLLTYDIVLTFQENDFISFQFMFFKPKDPLIAQMMTGFVEDGLKGPTLVTRSMKQAYPDLKMNGQMQEFENIKILPFNYAMRDFGGGENYSEHYYAWSWRGEDRKIGPYYYVFKNKFLKQHGLLLQYPNHQE